MLRRSLPLLHSVSRFGAPRNARHASLRARQNAKGWKKAPIQDVASKQENRKSLEMRGIMKEHQGGPFDITGCLHPSTPRELTSKLYNEMSLFFVGTSSQMATMYRDVSCALVRVGPCQIVIDAGEGCQNRLLQKCQPFVPRTVDFVLITHMHGDHLMGLPGMLLMLNHAEVLAKYGALERKKEKRPIRVVGPPGLYNYVCANLRLLGNFLLHLDVVIEELHGGDEEAGKYARKGAANPHLNVIDEVRMEEIKLKKIFPDESGAWNIHEPKSAKQRIREAAGLPADYEGTEEEALRKMTDRLPNMRHTIPSRFIIKAASIKHTSGVQTFGYSIEHILERARINPEVCKAIGVGQGDENTTKLSMLQYGLPVMSDDESRLVTPEDVAAERLVRDDKYSRKMTWLSDNTGVVSNAMMNLMHKSDILVNEATFADGCEKEAMAKGHSTPISSAELATKAKCRGKIILTHFSNRSTVVAGPTDPRYTERARKLLKKWNKGLPKMEQLKLHIACDGMEVYPANPDVAPILRKDGVGNEYIQDMYARKRKYLDFDEIREQFQKEFRKRGLKILEDYRVVGHWARNI